MIRDEQIDLTVDLKFGTPIRRNVINTESDLFIDHSVIDNIVDKIERIPWKHRPLESDDWSKRYKREDDALSNEYGATVRRTFDNKWFVAGDVQMSKYVREEFEYEYGLDDIYLAETCPKCGRKHFTKFKWHICPKCSFEEILEKTIEKLFGIKHAAWNWRLNDANYIPWLHADRDWRTNMFSHPSSILDKLR